MLLKIQQWIKSPLAVTPAPVVVAWIVTAVGIVLRIRQIVTKPDLWLDELSLALNVAQRDWTQLLISRLDNAQVSPPGFLQIAKLTTTLLGHSDFAFRLPALIFSILALVLFTVLALRILKQWEAVIAIVLVAISPLLLIYSAEFKQYSADVFAAMLLTLIVVELRRSKYSRRWTIVAALAPLVIVWLSDPSSIVLAGLAAGLTVLALAERDKAAFVAARFVAPAWSVALLAQYWVAKRRTSGGTMEMMQQAWQKSFLPAIPQSAHDYGRMTRWVLSIYTGGFGLPRLHGLSVVLMVLGFAGLWRSGRRDIALFVFGPIAVSLIVSSAHIYPARGRAILYLLPAFAIALATGVVVVSRIFRGWGPTLVGALLAIMVLPPTLSSLTSPAVAVTENITPVLAHIAAHRQPADRIYVFWGASPALQFYGPRYGINASDWSASEWRADDADLDGVWKDIDKFRGADRLWFVVSHSYPHVVRDRIVAHLDSIGVPILTEDYPGRSKRDDDASAFLYNMQSQK